MARNMTGTNSCTSIPTLKFKGKEYDTPQAKAEIIAQNIAETSSNRNYSDTFNKHRKEIQETWIQRNLEKEHEIIDEDMKKLSQDFAIHELHQSIRLSKNGSAPGQDNITYELLKHLPKNAESQLLNFYNKLWKEEKIVPTWKESIILPFHKPGMDRSLPSSYRPISLTDTLCKINERLITTRLIYYLESKNILNKYQSAYRKNRCTLDHLIRLHDHILRNINNKQATIAIFFDFSKAFDMLWKEGLMHKIEEIGIRGKLANWIRDFLTDRSFRVEINGCLSQKYGLENGTPQGSVISPILFLLMINDFPSTVTSTETSLFADDSAIWRSGRNMENIQKQLQLDIDKIKKWCDTWGFKLNKEKTVSIVFSKNYLHRKEKLHMKIDGRDITTVTSAKFLGMIFDQQLNWNKHIENIVENCKKKINLIRSLTGHQWGAGKQSIMKIYRTLIRPKMEYGMELFHTAIKSAWRNLEIIQSTCLRLACGAMCSTAVDAVQQECGEPPIKFINSEENEQFCVIHQK